MKLSVDPKTSIPSNRLTLQSIIILEKLMVAQIVKFPASMETEFSLPCSQDRATGSSVFLSSAVIGNQKVQKS